MHAFDASPTSAASNCGNKGSSVSIAGVVEDARGPASRIPATVIEDACEAYRCGA